jgi:zinc and cadmium transporter
MSLVSIIASTFLITLCVWVGILFSFFKKEFLNRVVILLVALSAGSLIGGAFIHLLPEASETLPAETLFGTFILSFVVFFLIERVLHWRHCHKAECAVHTFGYMNLVGDTIHNFIDGLVIAGAFIVDFGLGISTTIAVAIHEIPQEIGDYGVLIYAGFSNKKALILNYLIALTVILGGIVGYFSFQHIQSILPYLLTFAAGGFVYIAASDLMPEIKRESNFKKSIYSFLIFIVGISIMYLLRMISH